MLLQRDVEMMMTSGNTTSLFCNDGYGLTPEKIMLTLETDLIDY